MQYEMMKVFDCCKMPKDVHQAFFDIEECGNDCYVDWWNHLDYDTDAGDPDPDDIKRKLVNDWLLANGMEETDKKVLISHWW